MTPTGWIRSVVCMKSASETPSMMGWKVLYSCSYLDPGVRMQHAFRPCSDSGTALGFLAHLASNSNATPGDCTERLRTAMRPRCAGAHP